MPPPLGFSSVESASLSDRPLHLAVGMFDGVHLGHRAVIAPAVAAARASGGRSAVLTFRPHPSRLFRPDDPTRLIFDTATQAERIGGLGVDALIVHPFTREFAAIPAEAFLPWLRQRLPSLASIHVGDNWRFGAGRQGDVATLKAASTTAGVTAFCAPPVCVGGEPVTSTRIRRLLVEGEIDRANALLGSSYAMSGSVVPGRKLGRTIGFPTLNLPWDPELRPRFGVYRVNLNPGGVRGIANYGVRPTVEAAGSPLLEIHVLGECAWGPGDRIAAEWKQFLRPEMRFPSLAELKAQIACDIKLAYQAAPDKEID